VAIDVVIVDRRAIASCLGDSRYCSVLFVTLLWANKHWR